MVHSVARAPQRVVAGGLVVAPALPHRVREYTDAGRIEVEQRSEAVHVGFAEFEVDLVFQVVAIKGPSGVELPVARIPAERALGDATETCRRGLPGDPRGLC